jgi:acyl-CoA reductase-like NAD-dependent aldehyde dehydrogenase
VGDTLAVTSPHDGSTVGDVPLADAAGVEAALARAHDLYRDRDGWLPLHRRVDILQRLADLMAAQEEDLARLAAAEGGKPLVDSRVEASRATDGVRLCIETIRTEGGNVVPVHGTAGGARRVAFTTREPIGVVVAVSAFNHPLNLIVHQAAAAVAAGCPVIVKPAEDTPLSCRRFVALMHEAGLPPAWCQFLMPADLGLAEALVTDARVAFFSFIGSARVGWMLRSKLAPGTRCALEHGGAAPAIVAADADLEVAVPSILKGGYYHAGQVCVSVQRVFVDRSLVKKFLDRLTAGARALVVGDPLDEKTEVGPLIRPGEVDRVHEWVQEAREDGAEVACGGTPLALGKGQYYEPTVLIDPPAQARVSAKEIFGPVVCVYTMDDLDAAIEQANSLDVAFQAAIFTRNIDLALRVSRRIDASAVMVNDHTAFRVDGMPFAGLRQSGLGVGGIPYTIHDMQIEKMLVVKSGELGTL